VTKRIRYTIKAVVEYDVGEPEDISYLLEEIRQYGEATIENTEIIEVSSTNK